MVILDGYDDKQHYTITFQGYLYYQEYEKEFRKKLRKPKIKG